jgi:hypothetical protein
MNEFISANKIERKPSLESMIEIKKKALDKFDDMLNQYNFDIFSWESLYEYIRSFKTEIIQGNDVFNFDLNSFSEVDLDQTWSMLDEKLVTLRNKHITEMPENSHNFKLINSSPDKWYMDFDGKVKPHVENPVLLGGVHGDERTLPDELARLLKFNNETGLYKLNHERSYVNHEVNLASLKENVRSFSIATNQPDDDADMNRSNIKDSAIRNRKMEVLKNIARLKQPFVIDMHNEKSNLEEDEDGSYLAFVDKDMSTSENSISDNVFYKIKLAQELGIKKIIIADPEIAEGTMVEEVKNFNDNADGMIIEVPNNDTKYTSSKIALKYLALSGVINNGRPSMPLQMEFLLKDSFIVRKQDEEMEITLYKINHDVNEQLHPNNPIEGREYMIRNGKSIEIQKIKFS